MHSAFLSDKMRQELAREFANYQAYSLRKMILQLDAAEFADDVGYRVYTEWCLENPANSERYLEYKGEAYEKFLNDEVLFHLERRAKKLGRTTLCENHEEYFDARRKVVRGIVLRTAALLIKYDGKTYGWTENLRASLEEWIE